jgi:hypothetical protein
MKCPALSVTLSCINVLLMWTDMLFSSEGIARELLVLCKLKISARHSNGSCHCHSDIQVPRFSKRTLVDQSRPVLLKTLLYLISD